MPPVGLTYRRLLRYVLPYRSGLFASVLFMIIYASADTGLTMLVRPFVDKTFVKPDPEVMFWVPFGVLGLFAVRCISDFSSNYLMGWVGRKVIGHLRGELFQHILHLPQRFYDRVRSADMITSLTFNVEQVAACVTSALVTLVRDSVTLTGLLGWMVYLNWKLTLFVFLLAPIVAGMIRYANQYLRRYSQKLQRSLGNFAAIAEEVVQGQRMVKLYGGHSQETTRFEHINEENARLQLKLAAVQGANGPAVQMIGGVALACILGFAINAQNGEIMSAGSFISFMAAFLGLMQPLKRLTSINATIQRGVTAAADIFELLDEKPENNTNNRPNHTKHPNNHNINHNIKARGDLSFKNVTFRYPNQDNTQVILNNLNIDIRAGQTVAFVGLSGSGKSTLMTLLPRFYEPSSGEIFLDQQNLKTWDLFDLRHNMALVDQKVFLLDDTVANNIAYGELAGADRAAIQRAAEQAHAWEFIQKLPDGLDAQIGANGNKLSGGQRQRIAIARAFLKNAPILLLDEATSALDSESEHHVQMALENLMENRTTLLIAHRLATVIRADQIFVLEQGVILEQGTHQDLLAKNGRYAQFIQMQGLS